MFYQFYIIIYGNKSKLNTPFVIIFLTNLKPAEQVPLAQKNHPQSMAVGGTLIQIIFSVKNFEEEFSFFRPKA